MSCTRNDIRLWTVNGVLLARAELTITGNFRLLCCAVSEVRGIKEWEGGREGRKEAIAIVHACHCML